MIWYVDINASLEGDGSRERPFKRINDAAKVAVAGDEVVVAPGIYREYVDPIHGGREDARIVYRSAEPLGAHITAGEVVKNWKKHEGTTWVARIDNGVFGGYNPYTTIVGGDWYFGPRVWHTGEVFLNGRAMYETTTLAECVAGEEYAASWVPAESIYKWYTEQDGGETVIYANFHGCDPNAEDVEISVRRNCFFPSKTGVGYITFSGFEVSKGATTWAPPAAFQDGMIGAHWSKGWIIEDCEVWGAKCCGISLGKYYDPENDHYFTNKYVKSPTQMERDAVCRGQYHGWTKENIGSHTVRRCNIHHCEQCGIVGRMGGVFSTIEDNHIHHINNMQQLIGAEIAGIKMHAAIDVLYRRNHIHHCTMGIWCDWQAQGTRITQNLMHDNHPPMGRPFMPGGMNQDVFIEVSHGPTLIDNNLLLSRASARLATQGVALVHNLMLGSFTSIGSGVDTVHEGVNQPRYTPYHIRHRTEVAGFMTIMHGDNRLYNNIFVQAYPATADELPDEYKDYGVTAENVVVGSHVFDEYPTYEEWSKLFEVDDPDTAFFTLAPYHFRKLPVWAAGNAYFNGAKPWCKETEKFVGDGAYVKLIEENGEWRIETNVYELLGEFECKMIDSDFLGCAFEPEQRFESADGTAIRFDRDYCGEHRGVKVRPGAFVGDEDAGRVLFSALDIE